MNISKYIIQSNKNRLLNNLTCYEKYCDLQVESIEEEMFVVEYFGERAIKVQKKFHKAIKTKLERLLENYDYLHPHIIIASADFPQGLFESPNFLGVASGNFLTKKGENLTNGIGILTHELGHYKLDAIRDKTSQDKPLTNLEKFKELYFSAGTLEMFRTFKDSNFIYNRLAGHPHNGPNELYASAFMIAKMGFIPRYKMKFYHRFDEKRKSLAEQIFREVQK